MEALLLLRGEVPYRIDQNSFFFCGELEASAFITWRDAELCGGIMVRILWSVEELGQSYYSWKHILSYILREMP